MLIYHPAYDAYHCVFRALLITERLPIVETARLRILDFFLCFPAEMRQIRLPRELSEAKKLAQSVANEYHGPVSMHQAFRDLEHIQLAAFRTLAASNLFESSDYESGLVRRTRLVLPDDLSKKIAAATEAEAAVIGFIVDKLAKIPLLGVDGLKHRTGLMEHRYDVA